MLRLKGRNIEENQYVKVCFFVVIYDWLNNPLIILQMGAYHTIDLEVNRKFTLTKPEWDSIALERVDQACDPTQVWLFNFLLTKMKQK